ncbi:MAG: pirin family protein [Thermofilaceae archaeon]
MKYVLKGNWTRDGAGVKLYRVFGGVELAELTDPFLLLDHFGSRYPHEYLMGFPWHPHRGIETVTYLLKGEVKHADSTGVEGVIRSGDVQWMTAGSGIFHEEMPRPERTQRGDVVEEDPEVSGFQLWVNLPRAKKMADPSYKNVKREALPSVKTDGGAEVVLIAGRLYEPGTGVVAGPVSDLHVPVVYMDVRLASGAFLEFEAKEGHTVLAYAYRGRVALNGRWIGAGEFAVFDREGGPIRAEGEGRFLLLSGRPLEEPIAWRGPIVMNTWEEILQAFRELQEGTFIKKKASVVDYG